MAASVNYASIAIAEAAVITLGDVSRTAPANYTVLVAAAAIPAGMQIERLSVLPVATATATVMRFWAYKAAGAVWRLLYEIPVPAVTVAGGTAVYPTTGECVTAPTVFPKIVAVGYEVRVSMNDAQTGVQASVEGGGY